MASTNFKLFDENKTNMMSDTEYNINTQRLNGVQAGIASSQLQNKTLHQTSLVAYSLAQIMMQNGYDANDSAAVSAFVGNMSNSLLQKVLDKATSAEAKAGTITNKWISPATMKAAALLLSGGSMSGPINMGNNKITNLADPTDSLDSANKKYVDESQMFEIITVKSGILNDSSKKFNNFAMNNITTNQYLRIVGFKFDFNIPADSGSSYFGISFGTSSNTISFYYLQQRNTSLARTAKFCIFANGYKAESSNDYPSPMFEKGNGSAKMAGLSRGSVPYLYISSQAYSQNITGSISAVLLN